MPDLPAPPTFPCCEHCEHTDIPAGPHDTPCDHGCDDEAVAAYDAALEAAGV
jgi:hypothetical protein